MILRNDFAYILKLYLLRATIVYKVINWCTNEKRTQILEIFCVLMLNNELNLKEIIPVYVYVVYLKFDEKNQRF